MPTLLREAMRVARKVHHCEMCGSMIKVGERHHVSTNAYDGRVYDWRTCAACSADSIVGEVYDWAGSPGEGVGMDSASNWAHDCAEDAAAGAAARRWLARHGCTCERCEATS